jgi:hypothetical protein
MIKALFLRFIRDKYPDGISLCIPDTLSTDYSVDIVNAYKEASKAQRENSHNLMVFQHLYAKDCPFHDQKKCTGTAFNAKERAKKESKPFSPRGFKPSVQRGLQYFTKYKDDYNDLVFIHNCGRQNDCEKTVYVFQESHRPTKTKINIPYTEFFDNFNNFIRAVENIVGFPSTTTPVEDQIQTFRSSDVVKDNGDMNDVTYRSTTIVSFMGMMVCAMVFARVSI